MVGVDQVLEKLSTVIDPDLKKDIVSMGMIKDLELNSGNLKFTLELTTPACPFNVEIEDDVRKVIGELDGINNLEMKVTAKVMEGRSLDADTAMATVKNIIGVASGKGGVGKSTVSLNLALALSQTGAKVGLLDADVYGPSIPLMLGMDKVNMEVADNKLQPAESNGLKVVSFGFFAEQEHQAAIYRGPIISGILKQFLVVTTPQDVASNVAVKALGMFNKLNVPILGVVENMSSFVCPNCNENHYIFGQGGAKKISEKYNIPFVGEIPLNPGIMEGSDKGKPVMITAPQSPSAEAFRKTAKNIAAQCSILAARLQEEMKAEATPSTN